LAHTLCRGIRVVIQGKRDPIGIIYPAENDYRQLAAATNQATNTNAVETHRPATGGGKSMVPTFLTSQG
jgi:hypothetical protein